MIDHPLYQPLAVDQQTLIDLIGRPILVNRLDDALGWPTWSFVARQMQRRGFMPEEVVEALPSVQLSDGFAYGLLWFQPPSARRERNRRPQDRVGLTLAGLHHLGTDDPRGDRVDLLGIGLDVLRTVAAREDALMSDDDWCSVTSGRYDLRTDRFGSAPSHVPQPVRILGEVLSHEFEPLALPTSAHNYEIEYGDGRFQRFAYAHGIENYLESIDCTSLSPEPEVPPTTMDLGTAMDYLSLALRTHPGWTSDPLLKLSLISDAMTVAGTPVSRADFKEKLSALTNLLKQMNTVKADESEYKHRNWTPGSLNNLELWLSRHANTLDATWPAAIEDLRMIVKLRIDSQHSSLDTAKGADKARLHLGLQSPITDWGLAWLTISQRAASAIAAIALSVRRSSA